MTQCNSNPVRNPYRLTVEQFLKLDDRTLDEVLAVVVCDIEPAPALCTQLCEVDGTAPVHTAVLLSSAQS